MHVNVLKEIQALHQLGSRIGSAESLVEILQGAVDSVVQLLPADRVSLIELNAAERSVGSFTTGGPGSDLVLASVGYEELAQGLTGWVLREGRPAISSKDHPDPRESHAVAQRRRLTNCGSVLVVPLRTNARILGTMTAINRPDQRNFDEDDAEIMALFADYCAILIENTRLFLEQKRIERTLLAQNAMKDKLFTILAHDLRGPIGNTCVLLGLISGQLKDSADLAEILEEGTKAAYQTYNLTENLLGWIRGQIGEVSVLRDRIPVHPSLENVQSWLEPQARAKSISLLVECPAHLTVVADEGMLQTIVRNLVSNAIKYSPEGAPIRVVGRAEEGSIVIEVIDVGAGIPEEKLTTLFGVHQVDSKPGTNGERGNGLGLMFCADLARNLGGILNAESRVGEGSTFRLSLPDALDGEL